MISTARPLTMVPFLGFFVLLSQIADAQNRSWEGSSGDWNDTANWLPNDVPNSLGEIAILGGVDTYNVTFDLFTTIGGLDISNPNASLTFNPSIVNSLLAVDSDFTIQGTVNLNSNVDNLDVTLLRVGTVTNAATGEINFGGTSEAANTLRQLQINQLVNDGTVNVNQNGLFNRSSGVFTNNGSVNIASGKSLTFGTGNAFNQNAGTVNNLGTFGMSGDTLNFNGGSFSGNAIDLVSSALNIGLSSEGAGEFNMTGSGTYSGDLAAAQLVQIRATAASNSITTATADFTNHGTISLISDFDDRDVTLLRVGTVTNAATGEINFGGTSEAANTLRQLQINQLVNDGTVNVNQNGLFNRSSGVFTNNGSVNIASGKSLTFGTGNTFNQNAGTLNNLGRFGMSGDTLNFNGGSFSGNAIDLVSSALNIGLGSVGAGEFNMTGSGTYSGDLAAAQLVQVRATAASNSITTATANFTNHGTISLISDFDDRDVTLLRVGTVTNAATGEINFGGTSEAANTLRQLQINHLVNDGTVNVNQNGLFNRSSGVFTNNGSVNIASGKSLTFGTGNAFNQNAGTVNNLGTFGMSGDTLNFNGGSFSGNAIDLVSSALNIGLGSEGAGEFNMTGSGTYSGDLAAAQLVQVRATAASNSITTATEDFTNHGTLILSSDFDGRDITFFRNGTVTNSASGKIQFSGTSTASTTDRLLSAELLNAGTVDILAQGTSSRIGAAGDNHTNSGLIISHHSDSVTTFLGSSFTNLAGGTLAGLGEFDFAQTALVNHGTISPGLSPGTLMIDGNTTFGATANLFIELGGLTQGTEYDYLQVFDNLALNGILTVNFINGFENSITAGDSFTILTAGLLNGTFANLDQGATLATADGHGFFQVNYVGNSVLLSNFSAVPEPSGGLLGSFAALLTVLIRRKQPITA